MQEFVLVRGHEFKFSIAAGLNINVWHNKLPILGEGRNDETNHWSTTMIVGIALNPGRIIAWLMVGLIAGRLVGRAGGHRIIGDIIIGLIGSFLGGLIFSLFVAGDTGFWGSIPMALLGACILVVIFRAVTPRRRL